MKTLVTIFIALATTLLLKAQNTPKTTITVTVPNVSNTNGHVIISLHTKNTFMQSKPIDTKKVTIENGKATTTFSQVEAGEYAIIVLHDENDNNKMDYESNGMPIEDYGISNNEMSFGPPEYETAKFTVSATPIHQEIRF